MSTVQTHSIGCALCEHETEIVTSVCDRQFIVQVPLGWEPVDYPCGSDSSDAMGLFVDFYCPDHIPEAMQTKKETEQ